MEKQETIEIDGEEIVLVDENHTDFKLRLKYLYAEFRPPNISFLTSMRSEVGMGHMPWLDFEEHINPYRCQGTMFIERAGTFNSADLGVSIRGYLGRQLDEALHVQGEQVLCRPIRELARRRLQRARLPCN